MFHECICEKTTPSLTISMFLSFIFYLFFFFFFYQPPQNFAHFSFCLTFAAAFVLVPQFHLSPNMYIRCIDIQYSSVVKQKWVTIPCMYPTDIFLVYINFVTKGYKQTIKKTTNLLFQVKSVVRVTQTF